MSVIIRLQNLPWSANALDIRNFFRGLSIPEGGVHIVGGELGDAFIAFSTDEDARQAMMLDGGKIKEIQVKLLLSSRSEMHKVIEAARQSVPILTLTAPAVPSPVVNPTPPVVNPPGPAVTPFSAALGNTPISNFGIPGIGNPQEIPQPAVIEPPTTILNLTEDDNTQEEDRDDDKSDRKRGKEDRRRSRSRSRSRERDRKDRKRDRRDRSRSRERRRRDRSRSRDRHRKRDRKDRSRSRDRSPSRRSRDKRDRKSPNSREVSMEGNANDMPFPLAGPNAGHNVHPQLPMMQNPAMQNGPPGPIDQPTRFNDPSMTDTFNKIQELGKKRNPNAFQGEQQNGAGSRFQNSRGGNNNVARGGQFRREGRPNRDEPVRDICVAIRNAPNHTSYGDVRRFFPFLIDKHGIKMINDHMGRRTGNIFVKFCDSRSKHMALQRKVNELKGAQVVVEDLDDETYESAVDSFLPYRDDNDDDDQSLIIADNEVAPRKSFSVIKLTDLPYFVKEHDIIKTFSDYSLLSIMLNECRVTRSKIAYVQFVKPEDAQMALDKKDKYLFGRRQATLHAVSDEDYEKEKSDKMADQRFNNKPEPKVPEKQERARTRFEKQEQIQNIDVPFGQEQVALADPRFGNQNTQEAGPRDPRQRRSDNGPAMGGGAPMQNPAQAQSFFPGSQFPVQPQNFGAAFPGPPFNAFPAAAPLDPRGVPGNWVNRPPFANQQEPIVLEPSQRVISVDMDDEPLDCVLMKGLPREATDRTIVTFLSDTGAVPARIHLMLDSAGMPSGDCFCEFRSSQEARQAVSKHGQNLDGCRVTVDLVARNVVEEALEGPKQPQDSAKSRDSLLGNGPPPQFFENQQRGGFQGRGSFRGRGGFDRGFDRGGFNSRGSYSNYRGRGNWNERGRGYERGRGRGFGRGRGGFENGRDRDSMRVDDEQDPALEDFGAPGCVVSMENVPFRATVEDIMGFFSDFDLTQDDVIRRYNERGQPTGDARVAFRTPFDAQRAVKTRQMQGIFDRRISLTIL